MAPVLHVVTWKAGELDQVLDSIEASGYGLTLGLHSRIDAVREKVVARLSVGNIYVNRNMIGAVVGVQPLAGLAFREQAPRREAQLSRPLPSGADHHRQHICRRGNATLVTMME